MNDTFETEYRQVATVLLDYGCMVAPYLLGGEWQALRERCARVLTAPPVTDVERAQVERDLDELLVSCVYNPNYRAFYIYRAINLPHLREHSHLIERALLHYYRRDYLSAMLCLLPAVEGTLRSYAGWTLGDTEPTFRGLVERVRQKPRAAREGAFAEAVAAFLARWLYEHTSRADFTLSYLNRHYALHGLGPETFYRATDCHRIFLFFDVFAEMLTYEGYGPKHAMIPTAIPEMDRRREHYQRVIMEVAMATRTGIDPEEALLREHARFVPEVNPPDVETIIQRWARTMGVALPYG